MVLSSGTYMVIPNQNLFSALSMFSVDDDTNYGTKTTLYSSKFRHKYHTNINTHTHTHTHTQIYI